MNTDSKTFKNYTPEEVDHFLDQIIIQVEKMIEDNKAKNREIALRDAKIEELTNLEQKELAEDYLASWNILINLFDKSNLITYTVLYVNKKNQILKGRRKCRI